MDRRERVDVVEGEAVLGLHHGLVGHVAAQDPREDIAVVIGLLGIDGHDERDSGLTDWPPSLPRKTMTEETPESLIPYDEIVQEALREVVGRVLHEVEKTGGLPGGHHFYITFKTRVPGVEIPKHLVRALPRRDDDRHPAPLSGT